MATLSVLTPIISETEYIFRDYKSPDIGQHVKDTYKYMHTHQTVDFVRGKHKYWGRLDHREMSLMDALSFLETYVDTSDPDIHIANSYHGFQTAEAIRADYPDKEWFQVVGLIHDTGKVMGIWGEPSWSVVGDTFPVGCAPVEDIAFGIESFEDNPDTQNEKYNTRCGMYSEHCGLDDVLMSWGHDEYLYQVLKGNSHNLPEEALYMIRYHSFHPWHKNHQYLHLCNDKDAAMVQYVREFCKYDLYSKTEKVPDVEALTPYYQGLLDKYVPGKLKCILYSH